MRALYAPLVVCTVDDKLCEARHSSAWKCRPLFASRVQIVLCSSVRGRWTAGPGGTVGAGHAGLGELHSSAAMGLCFSHMLFCPLPTQGVTATPFRVVDEINQGMDSRNERKVRHAPCVVTVVPLCATGCWHLARTLQHTCQHSP